MALPVYDRAPPGEDESVSDWLRIINDQQGTNLILAIGSKLQPTHRSILAGLFHTACEVRPR
jgi:hypothetical protein